MARVDDVFHVHRARSGLFDEYEPGAVAYISNSADTNGVVGFVQPEEGDAVFRFPAIVVNAFSRTPGSCGARVQTPPFIACGRSGNGLLILEPKRPMTLPELAYYAAFLNEAHGWRFTWYRQATKGRLTGLSVPANPETIGFPVRELLPQKSAGVRVLTTPQFGLVPVGRLFDLQAGDYHAASDMTRGSVPLISCGDEDHGVVGYVDAPSEHIYRHRLTIALNGRPLTTKYHPYDFAAKDDVAIATPRTALRITTLLFVQAMLNRERWRYSYYRKCFIDKLRRFVIPLPINAGAELDEDLMARIVASTPYWGFLKMRLRA